MDYDHVIANTLINQRVIYAEVTNYIFPARKIWHDKWNLHIMHGFVREIRRDIPIVVIP